MMIAWGLIKFGASQLVGFLMKHWRVVLPLIFAWYCLHIHSNEVERANKAEQALSTFKSEISALSMKREQENKIIKVKAEAAIKTLVLFHNATLEKVKKDYEKLNKNSVVTIANLRNELRDKVRSDSFSVPDYSSDTSTDTKIWRERHTALAGQYKSLKQACTITTADFNATRAWADAVCDVVVCTNE